MPVNWRCSSRRIKSAMSGSVASRSCIFMSQAPVSDRSDAGRPRGKPAGGEGARSAALVCAVVYHSRPPERTSVWQRVQRREEEDEIENIERDQEDGDANRDEAGDDARDGESTPLNCPLGLLDLVQANEAKDDRQNRQDALEGGNRDSAANHADERPCAQARGWWRIHPRIVIARSGVWIWVRFWIWIWRGRNGSWVGHG